MVDFTYRTTLNMISGRDDGIKYGLNGKVCQDPAYFCRCHKVFLSEADAAAKHCFAKPTFDMISAEKCNWLISAAEYEAK